MGWWYTQNQNYVKFEQYANVPEFLAGGKCVDGPAMSIGSVIEHLNEYKSMSDGGVKHNVTHCVTPPRTEIRCTDGAVSRELKPKTTKFSPLLDRCRWEEPYAKKIMRMETARPESKPADRTSIKKDIMSKASWVGDVLSQLYLVHQLKWRRRMT